MGIRIPQIAILEAGGTSDFQVVPIRLDRFKQREILSLMYEMVYLFDKTASLGCSTQNKNITPFYVQNGPA